MQKGKVAAGPEETSNRLRKFEYVKAVVRMEIYICVYWKLYSVQKCCMPFWNKYIIYINLIIAMEY